MEWWVSREMLISFKLIRKNAYVKNMRTDLIEGIYIEKKKRGELMWTLLESIIKEQTNSKICVKIKCLF